MAYEGLTEVKQTMESIWYQRFALLRIAGFTFQQALTVFSLLEEARAFRSATLAQSAMASLLRAYDKEEG